MSSPKFYNLCYWLLWALYQFQNVHLFSSASPRSYRQLSVSFHLATDSPTSTEMTVHAFPRLLSILATTPPWGFVFSTCLHSSTFFWISWTRVATNCLKRLVVFFESSARQLCWLLHPFVTGDGHLFNYKKSHTSTCLLLSHWWPQLPLDTILHFPSPSWAMLLGPLQVFTYLA